MDEAEADTVRLIFRLYLELGSLPALQRELHDRGIRTRPRALATGRTIGNVPLTNGPLCHILKNRTYIGEINHRSASYKSDYPALIDLAVFEAVQAKLIQNLNRRDLRKGRSNALLTGCIFDDRSNPMSPTHVTRKDIRYRYYVSTATVQGRKAEAGTVSRVPAKEVETIVSSAMRDRVALDEQGSNQAFRQIKLRVSVGVQSLELRWLDQAKHRDNDATRDASIVVPYVAQLSKRRRATILPDHTEGYLRPIRLGEQHNLIRAIAEGRAWLKDVLSGSTIRSIAQREKKTERMIRMTLSLAFLDPRLARAALYGNLPRGVSMRRLIDAPIAWHDQWRKIALSRPA